MLQRFPLCAGGMLRGYLGPNRAKRILRENSDAIFPVTRRDGETYYAASEDDFHLLPGVSRRELVRKYAVNRFGYKVLESGLSPCKNADLIFFDKECDIWYRIWGDMGYLAPDSLMLFRAQPLFGSNLIDIIVTAQGGERAEFLKVQTEMEWTEAGPGRVQICDITKGYSHRITAETTGQGSEIAYDIAMEDYPQVNFSKSNTPKMYNNTRKKSINIQRLRSAEIAVKSAGLSVFDYDLLRYLACNPFLELKEAAVLYGGGYAGRNDISGLRKERDSIAETQQAIGKLTEMGLLRRLDSKNYANRYILTWQAIDLLGAYHGAIPLFMQKYCQWPQKKFTREDYRKERKYLSEPYPYFDSHNRYADKWGENLYEHQKLCRKFSNALISGARTLKSQYGVDVEVDSVNTIAANLKAVRYINGKKRIKHIHPDGRCTIRKSDSLCTSRCQLFLEIERNTNSKEKLIRKIENYRKIIPAAKSFYKEYDDIILVFFFDDRDNSHGSVKNKIMLLLDRMKKANIRGYISTYSLAVSNIPATWSPKYSAAEDRITGGMMVYRKIWYSTRSPNPEETIALLDISFDGAGTYA